VFAQKPLFPSDLHLSLFFVLISFGSIFSVKLFLPSIEVLDCNRGKGSEFGSLKHFLDFLNGVLLNFVGSALHQILMNPASGLLHDIKNNRFLVTISNYFINLLDDVVDIVPSQAGDRLDLVAKRSERVLLGELEHDVDLVFELIALIGFAEDVEFVRGSLLDHLKLIEVDVG
jgi:hypothetical protein